MDTGQPVPPLLAVRGVGDDNGGRSDWFAFPVDGGSPVATGAGDVLRAAGLEIGIPMLMMGDRVLVQAGTSELSNTWEIRLSLSSWQVQGVPHQLTFGTLSDLPASISATGALALQVGHEFTDLYLIPLSPGTGQPTGVVQRLTQDGRNKRFAWFLGGNPGSVYFSVVDIEGRIPTLNYYALDLGSGKQTPVTAGLRLSDTLDISPNGRQVAYSIGEGDSYSIRVVTQAPIRQRRVSSARHVG